jgi:hypothetical protein
LTFSTAALSRTSFVDQSRSGLSVGLIVGMSLVGVVLICVAVAAVVHRRKHQLSDESSQSDRLTLHLDFTDDQINPLLKAENSLPLIKWTELTTNLMCPFSNCPSRNVHKTHIKPDHLQ